jgi:hypothetical protein
MRKAQRLKEEAKDILANAERRAIHRISDAASEALEVNNSELRNEIKLKNCLECEREKSDKKYAAKITEVILFAMIALILFAFFATLIKDVIPNAVIK